MRRSNRSKEKYGKSDRHSLANSDGGSAARTRPLSFGEIMLRRKTKGFTENHEKGATEEGNIPSQGIVEDVSNHFESQRGHRHHKDASVGFEKLLIEEPGKVSSRRKEDNGPSRDYDTVKTKYRETKKSGTNLKRKVNLDAIDKDKGHGTSEKVYTRIKSEILKIEKQSCDYSKNETLRKHSKDAARKGRIKSEIWKIEKRSGDDSGNETKKKHSQDSTLKNKHEERSRGRSERESKRKYQNGDGDKYREGNAAKKHDISKRRDLEIQERKKSKESLSSQYEGSDLKRRRSRSRDHDDRNRRSLSPRAHKNTSNHSREHKESSSHSFKDRPGRECSEVDRNRISTNGSSNQYRKNGGSSSGLGGYSPRKRRSEVGVDTSPSSRSPEKKNGGWDLPPAVKDSSGSFPPNLQPLTPKVSSVAHELPTVLPVALNTMKSFPVVPSSTSSTKENASNEPVQLTQATRPMRRLYVENIPSSASEKDVMECINNLLLSTRVNRLQGSQPCISCIINKEKGQALVEFLTPADASKALSFDGSFFSGSVLKIRRPRDFVELSTGDLEKSGVAVDTISDIVEDSPNKIFIGGISKALSSKMLMDIASAFGPLKAYRFEINEDLNGPCAFLEYVDQSVTLKAFAGLNSMKLGGQVLTVAQAIPNATSLEDAVHPPCYRVPEHAKPLLQQPTQVLKLRNVIAHEGLSMLSGTDIEEILEDIRLECTRFGSVKSIHVVKPSDDPTTIMAIGKILGSCDGKTEKDNSRYGTYQKFPSIIKELEEEKVAEFDHGQDSKFPDELVEEKSCQMDHQDGNVGFEDMGYENKISQEPKAKPNTLKLYQSECHDDKVADCVQTEESSLGNNLVYKDEFTAGKGDIEKQEAFDGLDSGSRQEPDETEKSNNKEPELENVFDPGSVFVEYGRIEASTMAAHCLHGRVFNGQIVSVEYVSHDLYFARFSK